MNAALHAPLRSSEYTDEYIQTTRDWLAPLLFDVEDLTAETVGWHLRHVVEHPIAKAALEIATIDAQLRDNEQSFSRYLGGGPTVSSGVSVGMQDTVADVLRVVSGYL